MSAPTPAAVTDSRTLDLIDRLFPRPRNFDVRLADGTVLPGAEAPVFALVLKHPGALRRMFSPPIELSLGESYIYGDFDLEGDIFSVLSLVKSSLSLKLSAGDVLGLLRAVRSLPRSGPPRAAGRGQARLRGRVHSRERDLAAIRYHYDVGNEFYSLWLDRRLQYSCAYFPTGSEDLDTAQEAKIEHICRKLRLRPGERLLDVGCGWGGLAAYAAQKYDVNVLGVTLSARQAEYGQGIGHARVRIEMRDYRDLEDERFDKIVSVGMFEHVGRSELPSYFAKAYELLEPGGLFLNHGISHKPVELRGGEGLRQRLTRRITGEGFFEQRYVFPDGQLVPVSEANLVAEKTGFEVRDVENLREHYALTLRHWVNRLEAWREEAIAATDEVTYRTWRLYMAAASYGFDAGLLNVNQTLLAKPEGGRAGVPQTRADLYTD
jgi:cyclopropane-fatty-acyl-phospholipid synthase